jgi:RHS repeat-associated protein
VLCRIISIVLTLALFTSSTPAAPQIVVTLAKETSVSFLFWYNANGLAKLLQGQGVGHIKQEKQKDRDARVTRLEISPTDVTIDLSDHVRFVAVAYDADGKTVGGVKIKWSSESSDLKRRVRVSNNGDVQAMTPGTFTIIAQTQSVSAQTKLTVNPTPRKNLKEKPIKTEQVSTRDLPPSEIGSNQKKSSSGGKNSASKQQAAQPEVALLKRAHTTKTNALPAAAAPFFVSTGWDGTNYWSADDPGNTVGNPPGAPLDGGAGSGNFQFSVPVLNLPGRGINISLALAYNSRLWNKANSQMSYDNDKGWPAPGFSLGFGKLLGMTINTGCMLVDADGTRHGYTGSITFYSWGTYGVMHTTDGSFIDYSYWTGTNGVITWAQARMPNGTVINYGAYSQSGGGVFPTSIEDVNGNIISISYVNNSGPRIQTITDTLGRTISFYYDYNNLLTAITAPGYNNGAARVLARLHYHQLNLTQYSNYGFSGSVSAGARDPYPWVVDAIYFPGTGTGYWFNDSDSYSSFGMLAKVVEQRGMGFSASSLTDMGTVSQGSLTRRETYSYPLTPDYTLTDAPTYGSLTETWSRDGTNFDSATTSYDVHENDNPRTTTITLPNGTKTKQYSYNSPGTYLEGLVYQDVTFTSDENSYLQKSTSSWEPGAYGAPRPTRVEKFDERGQKTAAEFSYGSVYNQVTEVRDYDYGGTTLIRSTRTTYQNSSSYTNNHVFNLPLTVEVYDGSNNRISRAEYQYDGQSLTDAPNVYMHDETHNPYAPLYEVCECYQWDYWYIECLQWICNWVSNYSPATDYRGNVTQITSYTDAAGMTGAIVETRAYDITGNMVTTSTSCCEQTTFSYSDSTQYAYPESKTRGSATDWHGQVVTSATYDFNTGLGKTATDANNRTSITDYNANTLRATSQTSATGAHTDYSYDDNGMSTTTTTYLASGDGGGIADQNIKYLTGRGHVRIEKALGANSAWDEVDTTYNNLGNISQQSRPYRVGSESPQMTTITYDALGRTISMTAPDGSVTQTFYNEATRPSVASSAAGETMRVRDAWDRERWGRTDANGRLVEIVEPDPNSSGSVANNGMVTTYAYNILGNLTQVIQGSQTRSFKYDSFGRLTAQKLAEMSATLNDAGTYVGSGTWSDVFTYDERSNLTSRTDARGVKTVYTYSNDPLNRLQSVSWNTSGFGDTSNPILGAATVSYSYRTKGSPTERIDVTQTSSITTSGISTESFTFDTEGRISARTLTLTSRSGYPFDTNYIYDSLDRVKDVQYPREYGNGSGPRKLVHHDYDVASRLSNLTFDGQTQASSINYNAASQATSLNVGTGTNQVQESYTFNAQTGFLNQQTAIRNGSTLLNLSYDYAGANGKRTGQLVKISNNLDHNKDRGYEYDAVARLKRATGGQVVNWAQRYWYDRYGNRTHVLSHTADQYIRNFYQSALARQPNATELNSWLSTLQSAYAQGPSQFWSAMQALGAAIFTSQEYANRGRSDHWYVYDLYAAYLWREPDSGGWSFWEQGCAQNGRNAVRAGFDWSLEFELHVSGTAPYSPAAPVPRDGWGPLGFGTADANNHIALPGWNYDAAGNQTRVQNGSGWQRFQYDAANRLVKVKADDNVTVLASYTYGSDNQRVIAEDTSQRTYYVDVGGPVLAEYSEALSSVIPVWTKGYVYLGNRLLSMLSPNGSGGETVQYQHPDRLGTRLVTNPATGGSFEQVTLPFGTALSAESTGSTNRRFTSYDRNDALNLDYAVNRQYDPQQGRFTQVDPIGMKSVDLSSPQTLNLYAYCSNDPINRTDADGLGFLSFLKKLFLYVVLALVTILVVTVILLAVTTVFSAFGVFLATHPFLFALTVGLLGIFSQHFVLTVYNGISDEIREHGFSLGSLFRGFGRGLSRFFKSLVNPRGFLGLIYYGNYCGPGNPNQASGRDPIDELDAACREHDKVYQDPNASNRDLARADFRLAWAAFRAGLRGFLSRTGRLYSLFATVGFIFFGIFRTLFGGGDKAQEPTTINVTVSGTARPRSPRLLRQTYRISLPSYPEIISPAPQRIDRFQLAGT